MFVSLIYILIMHLNILSEIALHAPLVWPYCISSGIHKPLDEPFRSRLFGAVSLINLINCSLELFITDWLI